VSSLIELKYVNKLLRLCKEIIKKPNFDPLISIPGVNNNINTVNITKLPLISIPGTIICIQRGLKQKPLLIIRNWLGMG
jgi:hypothetical protein